MGGLTDAQLPQGANFDVRQEARPLETWAEAVWEGNPHSTAASKSFIGAQKRLAKARTIWVVANDPVAVFLLAFIKIR